MERGKRWEGGRAGREGELEGGRGGTRERWNEGEVEGGERWKGGRGEAEGGGGLAPGDSPAASRRAPLTSEKPAGAGTSAEANIFFSGLDGAGRGPGGGPGGAEGVADRRVTGRARVSGRAMNFNEVILVPPAGAAPRRACGRPGARVLLVDGHHVPAVAPHEHGPGDVLQEDLEVLQVQVGGVAPARRRRQAD